jgi:8-oxo-dGTP pyrophosphatase MutT (NUDIX family)
MNLSDLKKAVAEKSTETGELGAIQRLLAAHGYHKIPKVTEEREDRKVVRTYHFEGTPVGDFTLVTGPNIKGQIDAAPLDNPSKQAKYPKSAAAKLAATPGGSAGKYFGQILTEVVGSKYGDYHNAAIRVFFAILGIKVSAVADGGYTRIAISDSDYPKAEKTGIYLHPNGDGFHRRLIDLARHKPVDDDPYADYKGFAGFEVEAEFVPLMEMVVAATAEINGANLTEFGKTQLKAWNALIKAQPKTREVAEKAQVAAAQEETANEDVALPKKVVNLYVGNTLVEVSGDTYPIKDSVIKSSAAFKFTKFPVPKWVYAAQDKAEAKELAKTLLAKMHPKTQVLLTFDGEEALIAAGSGLFTKARAPKQKTLKVVDEPLIIRYAKQTGYKLEFKLPSSAGLNTTKEALLSMGFDYYDNTFTHDTYAKFIAPKDLLVVLATTYGLIVTAKNDGVDLVDIIIKTPISEGFDFHMSLDGHPDKALEELKGHLADLQGLKAKVEEDKPFDLSKGLNAEAPGELHFQLFVPEKNVLGFWGNEAIAQTGPFKNLLIYFDAKPRKGGIDHNDMAAHVDSIHLYSRLRQALLGLSPYTKVGLDLPAATTGLDKNVWLAGISPNEALSAVEAAYVKDGKLKTLHFGEPAPAKKARAAKSPGQTPAEIAIPKAPSQGALPPDPLWDSVVTQADVDAIVASKTGKQLGSQPGGTIDVGGHKAYKKTSPNVEALATEAAACQLYRACGIVAPDARILVSSSGQTVLVSPWLNGTQVKRSPSGGCDLTKAQSIVAASQFPVDAWLANWDVAGLTCDNLMVDGDQVHRIDAGGTMFFRATGLKKPFTKDVAELKSMLDTTKAPIASQLYAELENTKKDSERKKPVKSFILKILDIAKAGNYIRDLLVACHMPQTEISPIEKALKHRAVSLATWALTFTTSPLINESLSQIDFDETPGAYNMSKTSIDLPTKHYDTVPDAFDEDSVLAAIKKGKGGISYTGLKHNPRRENPSGFTATGLQFDSQGNQYIEYRPKLKDGSRPRIRLSVGSNAVAFSQVSQEFREQIKAHKSGQKPTKTPRILLNGLWPAPSLVRFHAAMTRALGPKWEEKDLAMAAMLEVAGLPLEEATPELQEAVASDLAHSYGDTIQQLEAEIAILEKTAELVDLPDIDFTQAEAQKVEKLIRKAERAAPAAPAPSVRLTANQKKIVGGLFEALVGVLGVESSPASGNGAIDPSAAKALKSKIQAAIKASTGSGNKNTEEDVGEYLRWLAIARKAGLWPKVLDPGDRMVFRWLGAPNGKTILDLKKGGSAQFELTARGEQQKKALSGTRIIGSKVYDGKPLSAFVSDWLNRQATDHPMLAQGSKYVQSDVPVTAGPYAPKISTLARELGNAEYGVQFSAPPWLNDPICAVEGVHARYYNTVYGNMTAQHWTIKTDFKMYYNTGVKLMTSTKHPGFILLPKLTLNPFEKMPFSHEDEIMFIDLGEQAPLIVEIVEYSPNEISQVRLKARQSVQPPYGWAGGPKKNPAPFSGSFAGEEKHEAPPKPKPKSKSYGTVTVDDKGRVLMRKVAGGFGGAVWTFPKGGIDKGETPEDTAIRETLEETGWDVEVEAEIPGAFEGTTSVTRYFLAYPLEQVGEHDDETEEVRWVAPKVAAKLIQESPSATVRHRDLSVLVAALKLLSKG